MGSDMMVALGPACVHGDTILGLNCHGPSTTYHLRRVPRGSHAGDEAIHGRHLTVPQVRQSHAVIGHQPADGWGFVYGLNDQQVAIGVTNWHSRVAREATGLTGCECVRLALERSHSSLQAVEVLTDLLARYGQCPDADGGAADHIFLIADATEAFVLETAGRFWALQECRQTRAATGVALTRQDWRRLSPGLAGLAIEQGWWHDDGSKVDFAGCLDSRGSAHGLARRRWGRLSVALAQQAGAIDLHFCRRLLDEQHDHNRPLQPEGQSERVSSFLTAQGKGRNVPLGWFSFGPPPYALYFPLCPLADIPAAFGPAGHPDSPNLPQCVSRLAALVQAGELDAETLSAGLDRLQTQFDQEADAFLRGALTLLQEGNAGPIAVLAGEMMQRHVQAFDAEWRRLQGHADSVEMRDWVDEAVELPY